MELTQAEADDLILMPKIRENEKIWKYPISAGIINIPIISNDGREEFLLDIRKTNIALKITLQKRCRKVIGLIRLDCGGRPHRNPHPDCREIPCPHIHIYKEGFGLTNAEPLPPEFFNNINDPWITLQDFMKYCNVIQPPNIQFQRDILNDI